ncbi:MAG: glutamyl-Q tRNA(Asp) synthetase [Halioglobus sp.]
MPGSSSRFSSKRPYRGRFAPSPTGRLHLGSLIAALASYLDARKNSGTWLVRIDDLDPPREVPGAATSILESLQRHGLHADEDILWQSERGPAYKEVLAQLHRAGETFLCNCSRAMLGPMGSCQRSCAEHRHGVTRPAATRIEVSLNASVEFHDQLQGRQTLPPDTGNFLIHRKDGLYAYQLAVVVDDAYQGITHIIRGSDLLDTTPKQVYLQQRLGHTTPAYCHIPVISNAQGQKFSKQNQAPALNNELAAANLRAALEFLRQTRPPSKLTNAEEIVEFSVDHWSAALIPRVMSIQAAPDAERL